MTETAAAIRSMTLLIKLGFNLMSASSPNQGDIQRRIGPSLLESVGRAGQQTMAEIKGDRAGEAEADLKKEQLEIQRDRNRIEREKIAARAAGASGQPPSVVATAEWLIEKQVVPSHKEAFRLASLAKTDPIATVTQIYKSINDNLDEFAENRPTEGQIMNQAVDTYRQMKTLLDLDLSESSAPAAPASGTIPRNNSRWLLSNDRGSSWRAKHRPSS